MERRDEQSIEAVKLYYQQGLSQAEVATRMGLSRPTVAKLLAHGRERGFVTIEIHDPREDASEIALRLEQRFGLACARVAHGPDMTEGEAIEQVGRVGAEMVTQLVRDGMSVGVSWGRTMSALAAHLPRAPRVGVRVVQLKGGASFSERATHDFEIMRSFCEAFGAQPRYLPLPVIFQDTAMLSIVRRDRSIARMVLILLVAIGVFSILSPSVFLTGLNLQNMLLAVAEIGILSIAMMISMVTGGIDLSLVAIANLCAITVSTLYTSSALGGTEQWGPVIILIGLGVGLLCGLVNGVLIAYVGVTPILATLGTMQIFNGLAVVWTGGKTLYGSPEALTAFGKTAVAGVPLLFIVFGLVALLVGFILNRSPLGLSLSLEGSNGTAARFSGIRSSRILLSSYLLTGFLGSLTGIVFIARNPTASADYGASYVLLVIVIAVLGGTNPNGGFATVGGVFLAALTLQVVQSGFTSMRLSAFQYSIAQGVILIGVLVLDCVDWKDVRTRLTSMFRRPQPAAALNSGATERK